MKNTSPPPGRRKPVVLLRLSLAELILSILLLAIVISGASLATGYLFERNRLQAQHLAAPLPEPVKKDESSLSSSGSFVYRDIFLELPADFVLWRGAMTERTLWHLPPMDPAQYRALLGSCGMSAELQQRLANFTRSDPETGRLVIEPDDATVFSLPTDVRSRFYAHLAAIPKNLAQLEAFRFSVKANSAFLKGSGLDQKSLALFERLLFKRGTATCLSDVAPLLRALPNDEIRELAMKALSREPSLLMKIVIRPDTDVGQLLEYWGYGGRAKNIEPLLKSLTSEADGVLLDVVHLLPPFARSRLYSYPTADPDKAIDCFWSAMNFFNEIPDDRFLDPANVAKFLEQDHVAISKAAKFGDLVMFSNEAGDIIHACVYIADDVVFTKNGQDDRIPWILSRLPDVQAFYSDIVPTEPTYYRRKDR